jgi:hypothetical protein
VWPEEIHVTLRECQGIRVRVAGPDGELVADATVRQFGLRPSGRETDRSQRTLAFRSFQRNSRCDDASVPGCEFSPLEGSFA